MTGSGELWVREDGLPRRQILHLEFPAQTDYRVAADITVDFSNFGGTTQTASTTPSETGKISALVSALSPSSGTLGETLASLAMLVLAAGMVLYRHSKKLYAALVVAIIGSMLTTPLLQSHQVRAFSRRQAARGGDQYSVNSEQSPVNSDRPNGFGTLSVNSEQSTQDVRRKTQDTTAATLRVVGDSVAEDAPIALDAGWNLVSYLPRQGLPVADALQSIDGKYTAVLGYDQGALSYYPDIDPSFNTLKTMQPLFGYWIRMTEAATLRYPVTSDVLSLSKGNQSLVNSDVLNPSKGEGLAAVDENHRPTADDQPLDTDYRSLATSRSTTWANFYGAAHLADGTPLPAGTVVQAVDPDGVVCGVTEITGERRYGLLACYGDDPTTPQDEGAQPGDAIRFLVNGQEVGMGMWLVHGGRQRVPLVPGQWQVRLPLIGR